MKRQDCAKLDINGVTLTFHYWLYPVWLCMWRIIKNLEPCWFKPYTDPEVSMAVDHHSPLDKLIGALEKMTSGHNSSIINQQVDVAHLFAHLLCSRIHTLTFTDVANIGVNFRLEHRQLLNTIWRAFKKKKRLHKNIEAFYPSNNYILKGRWHLTQLSKKQQLNYKIVNLLFIGS